jgi:hypothetical protein
MSSLIQRDIELSRQRNAQQFEPKKERYLAVLTRLNGNLQVPNRPGFVYAQQLPVDDAPPPVPVLCISVQAREDLRVWIERNRENQWEVVDWWKGITQQGDYNLQAYLPLHGRDHEWPDQSPRADAVTVYPRALSMLRAYPGAGGGLTVDVSPLRYILDGVVTFFEGELGVDLSGSQPAATLARYIGIYLDLSTNAIGSIDGATTADSPVVTPDSPVFPDNVLTSAMVRLDGTQTTFGETDFTDLRMVIGVAETGQAAVDNAIANALVIDHFRDIEFTRHRVIGG